MSDYHFNFISKGDNKKNVVLFLHGFMGRSLDWQNVMSPLAENFYSMAVDLPGHGATVTPDQDKSYTMEATGAGLVRWLDEMEMKRCSLVGYSMGGRLALYLAVTYPDRFEKVVLESASPGLADEAERNVRLADDMKLADKLKETPLEKFIANWYNQPLFVSLKNRPTLVSNLIANRRNNDPEKLAISLRYLSTGRQPSLWDKLEKVRLPLGLIVGQDDDKFVQIATEMTKRCPGARMKVVNQAGHMVHYEQPDEYISWLRSFLGRNEE